MTKLELIADLYDAVFPLLMLCYGVVLGISLADWLASRAKQNEKPDSDKPEGDSK